MHRIRMRVWLEFSPEEKQQWKNEKEKHKQYREQRKSNKPPNKSLMYGIIP